MHLRRALFLFALVLGVAAIAASVSRPGDELAGSRDPVAPRTTPEPPAPQLTEPAPGVELTTLTLDAGEEERVRLEPGPATLSVEVDEPGEVEIADLGLNAPADPLTPAVFELFASEEGRFAVTFTPADGDQVRPAGTLVVAPER